MRGPTFRIEHEQSADESAHCAAIEIVNEAFFLHGERARLEGAFTLVGRLIETDDHPPVTVTLMTSSLFVGLHLAKCHRMGRMFVARYGYRVVPNPCQGRAS